MTSGQQDRLYGSFTDAIGERELGITIASGKRPKFLKSMSAAWFGPQKKICFFMTRRWMRQNHSIDEKVEC
jgi:hypothetical protein